MRHRFLLKHLVVLFYGCHVSSFPIYHSHLVRFLLSTRPWFPFSIGKWHKYLWTNFPIGIFSNKSITSPHNRWCHVNAILCKAHNLNKDNTDVLVNFFFSISFELILLIVILWKSSPNTRDNLSILGISFYGTPVKYKCYYVYSIHNAQVL